MTNLRIYIAIATFHPLVGGSEKQALLQCQHIQKRGYAPTVITLQHDKYWPAHDVIEGIPVIRVAGMLLHEREYLPRLLQKVQYLLALLVLAWTLWRHRRYYDIVHVYQLTMLSLLAAIVCYLTKKKLVVAVKSALLKGDVHSSQASGIAAPSDNSAVSLHIDNSRQAKHDLADLERLGPLVVCFTHFLLKSTRAIVVVLSSRMKAYLATYHFDDLPIQLIPNGVDTTRFKPYGAVDTYQGREQIVICVSRLSYEKGIDVLLRAWYLVHETFPQAQLLLVGDGPLRLQLEQLAKLLGLSESIEFAGTQHDIPAYLNKSTIAVLPSRYEGMPNALLEAMACGLPCVATRVSGSEDIVQDGTNGLLVATEDYQGLAQALITLLDDPALARHYGYAARTGIEQHYSIDQITNTYMALYQHIAIQKKESAESILVADTYEL